MTIKNLILALLLALFLSAAGATLAHPDAVGRPRWVLSGGASDGATDGTSLRATLGQPWVGMVSSGDIALGQGFWHGRMQKYAVYLPLVLR